ncbi:hypothetical protein K432DRAFT_429260 [Lepidopterella palustris CBS 459.81]|uniref:Uncharacterized protein n=1 Tax=Lepidopterella palustris CBS 459.81 TaxID=1314670 RepID=A0A8E2E1H4_9PEZI|nr:hypothetical protein K432DRAFT_429260 [Lepidopterella palustris CBS 459.81]
MPTPGLLFVPARITSPALTDSVFNSWYNSHHIPDVLAGNLADIALRFKSLDPTSKYPYLAVYRMPDVGFFADPKNMERIPMHHAMLPEGKRCDEFADMPGKVYLPIQSFEGGRELGGERGKVVFVVQLEPPEGGDEEIDEFYRKQHLDMLSLLPNYRRSTRYKTVDGSKPRYLAIHEVDSADMDQRMTKIIMNTEWAKKVIGNLQMFERGMYELITEQGKIKENLIYPGTV